MAVQSPRFGYANETIPHATARNGILWSASVTLGTTGQVSSFTLPDDAIGFRLLPTTTDVYFAVNEDPQATGVIKAIPATGAGGNAGVTTAIASVWGVGGVAKASTSVWEDRRLEPCSKLGTARTLRIRPATSSSVVVIEVY